MFLEIFNAIKRMEEEIGNNVKISLDLEGVYGKNLQITADWHSEDFHCRYTFTKKQLEDIVGEDGRIRYFIHFCKTEYSRKTQN
jgi:hypothetical protein